MMGGKGQLDMTCPPEMHNLMCVAKASRNNFDMVLEGGLGAVGAQPGDQGRLPRGGGKGITQRLKKRLFILRAWYESRHR